MGTLLLRFTIDLREHDISPAFIHNGPLFHRWLPDAENDAIVLDTGDPNSELKAWFERFGFKRKDGDFIIFDHKRREVDPDTMSKQAVLDAGPLMGSLKILGLSDEELAPLHENNVGDARYVALGKKVVKLIHVPVARFLDILRTNYGQYWIRGLEKWDSSRGSLGSYCRLPLNLKWSLDGGETWAPFLPDERVVQAKVIMSSARDFREYLTKDDWQELSKVSREACEPSLAALLLAQSHQSLDQGNLKHALIEGVSALEVAIEEFVRQKLYSDKSLTKSMQTFWQLRLPARLIPVISTLGTTRLEDVELAVEAIHMRNRVVHDGWNPPESAKHEVRGLLRTISALLPGPRFRFPTSNPGNKLMPLEEWEKLTEEDDHYG